MQAFTHHALHGQVISVNPATEKEIGSYALLAKHSADKKLELAREAYNKWRLTSVEDRIRSIKSIATYLDDNKLGLAKFITMEMGKPIKQAVAEVEKCIQLCEYYSNNAAKFLATKGVSSSVNNSRVEYEPLGVILGVMPWNFPFWQVFRFAIPTILAGNTVVVKHASNVFGCAEAIAKSFSQACPENVYTHLPVSSDLIQDVVAHDAVQGVSLTGSEAAGREVAKQAGLHLKKVVLELGGSDPYVVLKDANIAKAAECCATSRLINNGQSCIGAKRFIVESTVARQFEDLLAAHLTEATLGDPLHKDTDLGPLARQDLLENLHCQVLESTSRGAEIVCGGEMPVGDGYFYPATILTNVPQNSPANEEELFGPVAAIIPVLDEGEALQVANQTCFGLGSAIFTQDEKKATYFAKHVEAGTCFINDFVRSTPELPFGGIKNSGFGRELGEFGIHEFVNVKTIAGGISLD